MNNAGAVSLLGVILLCFADILGGTLYWIAGIAGVLTILFAAFMVVADWSQKYISDEEPKYKVIGTASASKDCNCDGLCFSSTPLYKGDENG